jgi:hypothetical protein
MRLSPDQAAVVIQRAVRARRARNKAYNYDTIRQAELELIKDRLRAKVEAREREFLFLSKLPAEAVLKLALRKQEQAAIRIQAIWKGWRERRNFLKRKSTVPPPFRSSKPVQKSPVSLPPDDFYAAITPERHEVLLKQIELKGRGDHDRYIEEYTSFLERQPAWEEIRLKRKSHKHEIRSIVSSLSRCKKFTDELPYTVENPDDNEISIAQDIHRKRIPDPKRWWKTLDYDNEWDLQVVGANILDQIQAYKLEYYRSREMQFARG